MQLGQLSERMRRVHVALTWLLSLSWFAVWVDVLSLESTQNLFEIRTTYNSGTLPYGADSDVLAVSPIECVVIAVIQNRQSKEVDFYRNWDQYKHGFGDLLGNFWLGNTHIHTLTETPCVLRVEVESLNGTFGFAEYSTFQVSSEISGYKLSVNGYSGNISDAMRKNNGQKFSTAGRDNDILDNHNCAEQRRGPWWHRMCTHANLNGIYEYDSSNLKQSVFWRNFYGKDTLAPMKKSRMMLKKQ
ncbi:angiopoietin-related protein 7-like [Pecten maximus]|uniref:angiopoietin-related protein 7-like n=1 Tax=Pecten maximus TaxID=6579 RepID=UPI001458954A|nr:angiopoietin-related protein 7-like [Pecten maximus]